MTTFDDGRKAESVAAEYLKQRGLKVVERNWRTRWCEIDLVATQKKCVYFVEVKYRRNDNQGSGFEYITGKKLDQMHFAAESWIRDHDWDGESQLAAIEVGGADFNVTNFTADLY
jgi:ribonuclease HII